MATNGITTLGNRTFLFGASSGIDTTSLITAAYNQRKAEADKLDLKVTSNTTKMTALSTLQSLGKAVQDSLSSLKKNYSVLTPNASAFDARSGTLSSSSTTPATNLVSVSIDPGTPLGSYEIEVSTKASAQRVGGNSTTTDKDADLGFTGTFDIGAAGGTASTINVTSDMSISEVASAINAVKGSTGVSASVLKTSESGYQLILSATNTNKAITVSNVTGTDVMQGLGLTNAGGSFVNELQPAQGATVLFDGVPVTRDDNDFSDVLDGVNVNVLNAEPGTKIQLQVTNDTSAVKNDILNFTEAYNNLRDFILAQQKVTDGEVSTDAVLFGDTMLKNMTTSLQGLIGGNYGQGGGNLQTLQELGIKVGSDGKLTVNESTLDDKLMTNFDQVRAIFETSATVDNAEFKIVTNTSQTKSMSFALDITYSGGAITNVSVGGDNTLFTVNGSLITGKAGTAYEGMSFAYVGTSSTTVNVGVSQGLADLFSNTANNFTDSVNGLIQGEVVRLDEINTTLEDRSARVLERADAFRETLIDKYSRLESQMSAAQTTLAQIQAILNAGNKNN